MKKILFFTMAIALLLTACQEEALQVAGRTDEVVINISASAPELMQRSTPTTNSAKGGLTNIDWNKYDLRYILEIYDADGTKLVKSRNQKTYSNGGNADFQIRLTPDRTYRFVVWADFVEEGKTTDLHYNTGTESFLSNNGIQIIQDNYSINDESRDAYFVSQAQEININSAVNLTLTRPFAKLRIVATDIDELEIGTYPQKIEVSYDKVTISAFEPITGLLHNTQMEKTLFSVTLPEQGNYATGYDAENGVQTLFVDYIFAGTEQSPIQFEFSAYDNNNAVINTYAFDTDIPLQRNYLTTIIGNILTTGTDINTSIEDSFNKITLTWAEFLEANSLDMGYGGNNSNITIDGENKYIISDWVDAWYTGNLTVKNITFNQGATFTTEDTNEGTVLIENSTFYACDQDLLVAAGESVYGRIDNSGDGLCLDIETGDKTIVKVLNNKFIGENDATVDRNGYKNWTSVTNGSKDKARGHAICINGIAGQGNATSVLIEGNTITGVRGNSIQLYTFNYPITVTGNTINSWGINKQTAAGEKSDAAIRGDIKAGADVSLLTVTNNYFGLDEIAGNILHVNVNYSDANTDGTRKAGTY